MSKKFLTSLLSCFFLLNFASGLYSQVSINGPTCGVIGSTSTFNASGADFSGVSDMQWCVSNGNIVQAFGQNVTGSGMCRTGTNVYSIIVQWTSSGVGTVSLTTPVGNANSHNVTVVSSLLPGTISNPSQTIAYNTTPATLNCSVAANGWCGPSFSYQWEISTDNS